ncbi:MAG: hypothetical protein QOI13_398, partial [Paraburkholderia sp.]|nr:hypothetical protein [Paraburkholderia sp.]
WVQKIHRCSVLTGRSAGPAAHLPGLDANNEHGPKRPMHEYRNATAAPAAASLRDALRQFGGRLEETRTNRFLDARTVETALRQQLGGVTMIDEAVGKAQL